MEAGVAVTKMLLRAGVGDIAVFARHTTRKDIDELVNASFLQKTRRGEIVR